MNDLTRSSALHLMTISVIIPALLPGCAEPEFDTSTPPATLDSMQRMIADGRADLLPTMIHLQPREVTFEDGVTEASAIAEVKAKAGDMLGQLWRVSRKLHERFPDQVATEGETAAERADRWGLGQYVRDVITNPFQVLNEQRDRISTEDLGDGTALVLFDDEPVWGGNLTMIETDDGWRFYVPVDLLHETDAWPQTRYEWSVIASMMLGLENSLRDFEKEIDDDNFRSLRDASERAGRLIGESVVAQSIIYAYMKREQE